MITAPVLAYPQAEGSEFILDTDASAYAIGAVLSQVQDGMERVIAYGSRCLDKPDFLFKINLIYKTTDISSIFNADLSFSHNQFLFFSLNCRNITFI